MIRAARAVCLALGLVASLAAPAGADEERLSITLRGGGLVRDDAGYADHAAVHGLGDPQLAGGGVLEVGVRFLPRLWLVGSWSGFSSLGARRLDELSVGSQALLAHLGVTAWRAEMVTGLFPWSARLDLTAGAGRYSIADDLAGEGGSDSGPGARLGAQVSASWGAVGFALSYGWHLTGVAVEDRLGGRIGAGGHEIGGGFRLAF